MQKWVFTVLVTDSGFCGWWRNVHLTPMVLVAAVAVTMWRAISDTVDGSLGLYTSLNVLGGVFAWFPCNGLPLIHLGRSVIRHFSFWVSPPFIWLVWTIWELCHYWFYWFGVWLWFYFCLGHAVSCIGHGPFMFWSFFVYCWCIFLWFHAWLPCVVDLVMSRATCPVILYVLAVLLNRLLCLIFPGPICYCSFYSLWYFLYAWFLVFVISTITVVSNDSRNRGMQVSTCVLAVWSLVILVSGSCLCAILGCHC